MCFKSPYFISLAGSRNQSLPTDFAEEPFFGASECGIVDSENLCGGALQISERRGN